MRRSRGETTALRLIVGVVLGAVMLALVAPRHDVQLSARILVAMVAAVVLAEGLRWLQSRHGAPSRPLAPLVRRRPRAPSSTPIRLRGWENLVRAAGDDPHLVALLCHRLADLATARLADRRGIDATRQPEPARAALGPAAWLLDRAPSDGADAPAEAHRLATALDRLEEL